MSFMLFPYFLLKWFEIFCKSVVCWHLHNCWFNKVLVFQRTYHVLPSHDSHRKLGAHFEFETNTWHSPASVFSFWCFKSNNCPQTLYRCVTKPPHICYNFLFYFILLELYCHWKKKSFILTSVYNAEVKLPRYLTSKQNNVEFNDLSAVTNIYYIEISIWVGSPLAIMVLYSKSISCPKWILYAEDRNNTKRFFQKNILKSIFKFTFHIYWIRYKFKLAFFTTVEHILL